MAWGSFRRLAFFIAGSFPLFFIWPALPSRSASALAAWALEKNGVLELRTSAGADLKAFYQFSDSDKGLRVWIDFPGELITPRSLPGNGPVYQIRLGIPSPGVTRLVIEFNKGVNLDLRNLKLIGISPNRWKLNFKGMPISGFNRIGEGNVVSSYNPRTYSKVNNQVGKISSLPSVARDKFLVVIDPGHGGPDSGAVGIGGIKETFVVLDISLQVAKLLEEKGVKVRLTRKSEIDLDLPPRVAIANRIRADAFVSIHANASRNYKRDVNGIETFYFSGSRALNLSRKIQTELLKVSPDSPDRGVRKGRFFVIRRTNMPAALVEAGFLTGQLDAPRLANSTHRRRVSFAIAKGILNYLQEVR